MLQTENYQLDREIFENPLLSIHLKCLRWHGLLVDTTQRYPRLHLIRGSFSTLLFICFSLVSCVKVSRGFDKLEDGVISCALSLSLLSFSMTVLNAYFQRARVVRLARCIHEDLVSLLATADAVDLAHYNRTLRYLRLVTIVMVMTALVGGGMTCLDCFIRTIFRPETVFNVPQILNGTAQPILLFKLLPFGEVYDNFVVGYLGPWFVVFIGITTIPILYTFITCLMKYVTLKFEIMGERMRSMKIIKVAQHINRECDLQCLNAKELNDWRMRMCAFCVKEQVKMRCSICRFVAELEALIRIPVFMDFIICSLQICLLLYVLSTGLSISMEYSFVILLLIFVAFIQWIYHWHATLMAESSDALRFAVYSCDWYNYSLPVQKTIRLIMLGSNAPLVMRAFLVELNLKTFIYVVRAAYGYFNILRTTVKK